MHLQLCTEIHTYLQLCICEIHVNTIQFMCRHSMLKLVRTVLYNDSHVYAGMYNFYSCPASFDRYFTVFPLLNTAAFILLWDSLGAAFIRGPRLVEGSICKRVAFISKIKMEENEIMCQFKKIFLKPCDAKL